MGAAVVPVGRKPEAQVTPTVPFGPQGQKAVPGIGGAKSLSSVVNGECTECMPTKPTVAVKFEVIWRWTFTFQVMAYFLLGCWSGAQPCARAMTAGVIREAGRLAPIATAAGAANE